MKRDIQPHTWIYLRLDISNEQKGDNIKMDLQKVGCKGVDCIESTSV
jgi:hypothetical protein